MKLTARIWPEETGFVAECADPSEIRERMHAGTKVQTFDVAV